MGRRKKGGLLVTGLLLFGVISAGMGNSAAARPEEYIAKIEGQPDAGKDELSGKEGLIREAEAGGALEQEGIGAAKNTLKSRFPAPKGFKRTEEGEGTLGAFIRDYPLLPEGSPILLYNGERKEIQTCHAAVFDMALSNRDLQQCADSVMRVYGEYYWKNGQYDKIGFHFVNGFFCSYRKWMEGYRVAVSGNQTSWVKKSAPDSSWEGFEQYLNTVFAYAGTFSMKGESEAVDIKDMKIGDVFLYGGSPGHVVMVVDVCEPSSEEAKGKAFLLAQGYMPAQQFHVLKNPAHEDDPWYYTSELTWPFETPEYIFQEGAFRRMAY
ncbi:DUF4846 domain-containing protein [Lachnospiraceae bacterium 62-35]